MIAQRCIAAVFILAALGLITSCNSLPGKPKKNEQWIVPAQITDFNLLYAQNCSGCHGADGRLGAARPLNDPLYLALVTDATLRRTTAQGVPGTSMPAFAQRAGGLLTEEQINGLIKAMKAQWGRPEEFKGMAFPPYSLQEAIANGSGPGDPQRGAVVYKTYCVQCHGADGRGGAQGGSVVDPSFLALVSDQALRTAVIAGRLDLRKPDWRANVPGRPMSPQEISDVVAWLVSQRTPFDRQTASEAEAASVP